MGLLLDALVDLCRCRLYVFDLRSQLLNEFIIDSKFLIMGTLGVFEVGLKLLDLHTREPP
jgi:hypothetical protein